MAMVGEGETSYEGGGGAGGKFRKRPFRRPQTTPYDRPPSALRNHSRNGWLSKLVDPASKLISASAHMFFSSVFRKPLPHLPQPPPQPPPEANEEPRDRPKETVPSNCNRAREPAIDQGGNLTNGSDGGGISELEQILKQKTFTRSEIDHLTELLRSRTVELPVGDDDKRTEANFSKPLPGFKRHEGFTKSPVQENRNEGDKFHTIISTPVVSSRVFEENVASPAELAKAYMGSRPPQVSPSMLGLRSQAPREDATLQTNPPFPPKSPIMSLASKTAVRVGVPENGFMTPRPRRRSAIYSMARTPYSRVHPTALKGTGSTNYGYGGPSSSSQFAWEHDGQFRSKQVVLKRRSSVLDDDIGSVGAIRRIRQKSNLPSQGSPGILVSSNVAQHRISSTQKLLLLDEAKHQVSRTVEENGDNSIPSTSYALVPSKSSKMATKILQHLEKLTPKEKSSESKLIAAREKSPGKLTPNMLRGQALRSLEVLDSSKFLQNAQDSYKSEESCNTWLPDARDSTSQKQDKVEENGQKKIAVPRDLLTSSINGDATVSTKDTLPNVKNGDSIVSKFAAQPPLKKHAFQMSAQEDSLELDDDIHSDGLVSALPAEGREKLETSVGERKAVSTEAITLDQTPAFSEVKAHVGSVLNKQTDLEINGGSVFGEENTGFTFPTSPAYVTTFQSAELIESTSAFDKFVPPRDLDASPPLLSSKDVDKVPPFAFSASSSANEFSDHKFGSQLVPKPECTNSLANVGYGTTDTQLNILESDKGNNKITRKAGDIMGKSETLPSAASNSTSTSCIFPLSAPSKNSNLNNGPLSSSPSIFSSTTPVLASSNFSSQIFNNSSTHVHSSSSTSTMAATTTTTTAAFNSGLSVSAAASTFIFGSSVTPSALVSTIPTTSVAETIDIKVKTERGTTFGNVNGSPFGGSTLFGFSSSVTSSTANNQSQGSLVGTGSGSLVSAQASPPGTGVATVAQNMPTQFGSSGSSSVFGPSGITSFSSGSSLFGSSNPSGNLFSSGTSFGLSSSTSASETNFVGSTSGATSSTFGSSWQPSKSPIFPSSFSSPSPSTGFSFGASSTSVAATNSAPIVFGSSTGALPGSMSSFTSAAATTSSLPSLSQPQPVFGNSTPVFTVASSNSDQMNMEDSMAEDPVQASTPAVPIFGQPPFSPPPAGFMFNSIAPSPSSVSFQFGGQQNQAVPQNPSPFQASSSLDFSARGSFSLGSGGGDKSNRRIVRPNKNRIRKK